MTDTTEKSDTGAKTMLEMSSEHPDTETRFASLQFDPAKYRAEVDGFDLTEAQKQELLLTLWSIMRSFVELGFTTDVCAALLRIFSPIPCDGEVR